MPHVPVLLNEILQFLDPKPGNVILDATVDGGGHATEILKKILPNGKLVGIDQDKQLLDALNSQKNTILINGNFRNLDKLLEPLKIKQLDGVLFDLGMSSLQLEQSGRGFTFQKDEPLLMTYKFPIDADDLTAQKILNEWPEKDIADVVYQYGEERYARRIAKNICEARKKNVFKSTFDLVDVIKKSIPFRHYYKIHPATKTFQALRIAVNDEMIALSEGLEKSWKLLSSGSRLVTISFHSLEDRVIKNFFKNKKNEEDAVILTKKPVFPSTEEIVANPRARSAKLRAAAKK